MSIKIFPRSTPAAAPLNPAPRPAGHPGLVRAQPLVTPPSRRSITEQTGQLRAATTRSTDRLKAWMGRHPLRPHGAANAAPPMATVHGEGASRRADLAFDSAVLATQTFGPLVMKGAGRELERRFGPFEAPQPIPLAPDMPDLTMPGAFPDDPTEEPAPEKHGSTATQGLKGALEAPQRVRQHLEGRVADTAFQTVFTAGKLFTNGAARAAWAQLPSLPPFEAPPGNHAPMPGSFPGTKTEMQALLEQPPPPPPGREERLRRRAEDAAFETGVVAAGWIAQGAMQTLAAQIPAAPPELPRPSNPSLMPGAWPGAE